MSEMKDMTLVVAMSENGVIGRDQTLPWRLKSDLQRFKSCTMGHGLLMGRKTFESIGRVLPGRITVVLTRQPTLHLQGVHVCHTLEEAVAILPPGKIPFVVGGAEIYRLAMPHAQRLLLTRVHADIEGDATFDAFHPEDWRLDSAESFPITNDDQYATTFETWIRR